MPNPKTGTVTFEVEKAVNDIKAGKVEYRVDKSSNLHVPIGKVSFEDEKLVENFTTIMDTIVKVKPQSSKGTYVRNVVLTSTIDRKSTRLNSSHVAISYAVFCLK